MAINPRPPRPESVPDMAVEEVNAPPRGSDWPFPVGNPVRKAPVSTSVTETKEFAPFKLSLLINTEEEAKFLNTLVAAELVASKGFGGFSSTNQAKTIKLLKELQSAIQRHL